jgi:hypothetical protein
MADVTMEVAMLAVVMAAGLAVVLVLVPAVGRRLIRPPFRDDDARASVMLRRSRQADGPLPVGVVRVQNPGGAPVIVSVSVHRARQLFARPRLGRQYRAALSVRPLRIKRRPQPPGGTLLGAVSGGSASCWEVPVRDAGPRPVLKVRLDQTGLRSRLFVWRMDWPDAAEITGALDLVHP